MTDGINLIRYIFGKFVTLLFDSFTIIPNVSIGWIMVSIIIISIMANNILSVARSSQTHYLDRSDKNDD